MLSAYSDILSTMTTLVLSMLTLVSSLSCSVFKPDVVDL